LGVCKEIFRLYLKNVSGDNVEHSAALLASRAKGKPSFIMHHAALVSVFAPHMRRFSVV
jgi:hypothetical protein